MGRNILGRYRLLVVGAAVMAFIFCHFQGAFAWEYKQQGYKLDGKYRFPPMKSFGEDEYEWETVYPPEEQEKNLIKIYDKTNVQEIKEFLPPYVYDLAKNPKEWNNDEWKIR